MGRNLQYQAVPADSGFVELVRDLAERFPGRCWAVAQTPFVLRNGLSRTPGDDEVPLSEISKWCDAAKARYPGIEQRNFEPGKHIDCWRFLLSATYRQHVRWPKPDPKDPRAWIDPPSEFDALADTALFGAPQIAPGVCASQGSPVQYLTPVAGSDFGSCVAAIEIAELRPHIDEIVSTRGSGWDRELWMQAIDGFQRFWRETARRGDGVLVVYD